MGTEPIVHRVTEWLQSGAALRSELVVERRKLKAEWDAIGARLKEIDAALAKLPDHDQLSLDVQPIVASADKVSHIVLAIVSASPIGMAAPEIIREVQRIKPTAQVGAIRTAIFRLAKERKIAPSGPKGTQIYHSGNPTTQRASANIPGRTHPKKGLISPDSLRGRALTVLKNDRGALHAEKIKRLMEANGSGRVNKASLWVALSSLAEKGMVTRVSQGTYAFAHDPTGGAAMGP